VKKRIVLLGPPASGKGTQAELIQKHFGLPATSTGAILRREAKLGTQLGVTSHKIIRHVLHPEDPCPNCGGKLEARGDDTDDVLAHRMKEYREKSLTVTDFYGRRGILARVDADREASVVFDELSRLIIA
jgi:adenylate kinase family enzyme